MDTATDAPRKHTDEYEQHGRHGLIVDDIEPWLDMHPRKADGTQFSPTHAPRHRGQHWWGGDQ